MSMGEPGKVASRAGSRTGQGAFLGHLRAVALIMLLVGAGGSATLTVYTGRHNASRLLITLFIIWVLSPFMALELVDVVSKRWSVLTGSALYGLMLVLTVGSLAIYTNVAFWPPKAKTAFVFVVVPPASCLLLAVAVTIAALLSGGLSSRSD